MLLQQLVDGFYNYVGDATRLASTHPDEDLVMRIAIVGFGLTASVSEWDLNHREFVFARLQCECADEEIEKYGPHGLNVRAFYALALGFLLGEFHTSRICEQTFRLNEIRIPGVIMLHLPHITSRSLA